MRMMKHWSGERCDAKLPGSGRRGDLAIASSRSRTFCHDVFWA